MGNPDNTKPEDIRPNSAGSQPANKPDARPVSDYRRMSIGGKRARAIGRQREPAIVCPSCCAQVMPSELAAHQVERCTEELPPPHPLSRWLTRIEALRYCSAPKLDTWVERRLVRTRDTDGRYLERDLAIVVAWARALEAL